MKDRDRASDRARETIREDLKLRKTVAKQPRIKHSADERFSTYRRDVPTFGPSHQVPLAHTHGEQHHIILFLKSWRAEVYHIYKSEEIHLFNVEVS